jgi:uncharacterized protein with FMN-binding domain
VSPQEVLGSAGRECQFGTSTSKGEKTVTAAEAVDYPVNDPRDQEINSYAIPQLNSEALAVSSAQIDAISGATYTSEGYITSLQNALDKAGL